MAKVLILDQSKSIRNTLRERLEFEGIAAESAENEAAASVLCERIPFDLIISDHETRLPESDVPFIVLSSEATVDSAIKALRNGAQDYLTKPIDMNRLMQSIRQTLEQAAEAPRTAAKSQSETQLGRSHGRDHRHFRANATRPASDRQGRTVRRPRSDHGRERHGQGTRRPLAPRQKQPGRSAVR